MGSDRDHLLAELAGVQFGQFSRLQARRLGIGDSAADRRIAAGRWERRRRGVYRIAGTPDSWLGDVVAVALADRTARFCRTTAAALLGIEGFEQPGRLSPPSRLVGRSARRGIEGITSTRSFGPGDAAVVALPVPPAPDAVRVAGLTGAAAPLRRVEVTSAARTLIDLAAVIDPTRLALAVDAAVRQGLVAPRYLSSRLAALRGRGRRGVRLLDELLLDSGGHSDLERRFLRLMRTEGLPRPLTQVVHRANGRHVARVDFQFPGTRLIVEVSGRRGHTSDPDRRNDARRRNELQLAGYLVLEFVTADVVARPERVVGEVRRALDAAR